MISRYFVQSNYVTYAIANGQVLGAVQWSASYTLFLGTPPAQDIIGAKYNAIAIRLVDPKFSQLLLGQDVREIE
jgi:hypothetical protein